MDRMISDEDVVEIVQKNGMYLRVLDGTLWEAQTAL